MKLVVLLGIVLVVAVGLTDAAVVYYTKSFTATSSPTTGACGSSFSIPIKDGMGVDPTTGWTPEGGGAATTVSSLARIVAIGVSIKAAVPSGQWNFLSTTVTTGGLTGQIFPKGSFASACGSPMYDAANFDELTTLTVFEPATGMAPQSLTTPQPLPAAATNSYVPNPLNRLTVTNPNPKWNNAQFFPSGTLIDAVLGTINIDTGLVQFPVCWSTATLIVVVSNCPTNALTATINAENPPLGAPAGSTDSYRGSFITWRQLVAPSSSQDRVQIDLVTAWNKGQAPTTTAQLAALSLSIQTVPTTQGAVPISLLYTSLRDYDVSNMATPSIGTPWGGLGAVNGNADTKFPWPDNAGTNSRLSYDIYVKTFVVTLPGRSSTPTSRQVRATITGCCHPTSILSINSVDIPVISATNLGYSIEALMTLEHPSSAQFPRGSPEMFVPPIVWLGGSDQVNAQPDTVTFGGFKQGQNAEAGTVYSVDVIEVGSDVNSLQLQSAPTILNNGAGTPVAAQFKVRYLDPTTLSPSGYTISPALSGTTAHASLVQKTAAGAVISSTTYEFIALRRALDVDTAVDELNYCNTLQGTNPFVAYDKNNAATVSFTSAGTIGIPAGTTIRYQYNFPQNKQCGNQLGVRSLRTGSKVQQACANNPCVTGGTRVGNTDYDALWFLADDGSSAISPVFHDTAGPLAYVPQALFGLEVLAVESVGFAPRSVPVTNLYPTGVKSVSTERMGITYCYSRAAITCDTTTALPTVTAQPDTCVSPAVENTCNNNKISVSVTAGRGTGSWTFLFTVTAFDGTVTTLGSQTFTAPATNVQFGPYKSIAVGSTVQYYAQDPAGCVFKGTVLLNPQANGGNTGIAVTGYTQPACSMGTAAGGTATIVFNYNSGAAPAVSYSYSGTATYTTGAATTGINVTPTQVAANTWTFTTTPVVLSGSPGISFTLGGVQYKATLSGFTTNLGPPITTPTITFSSATVASGSTTGGTTPYSYLWTVGATNIGTTQTVTVNNQGGNTLTLKITDANGCSASNTAVIPGATAGAYFSVTIGGITAPVVNLGKAIIPFTVAQQMFNSVGGTTTVYYSYCKTFDATINAGNSATATENNCATWSTSYAIRCNPLFASIASATLSDGSTSTLRVIVKVQAKFTGTVAVVPGVGYARYNIPATDGWDTISPPACGIVYTPGTK